MLESTLEKSKVDVAKLRVRMHLNACLRYDTCEKIRIYACCELCKNSVKKRFIRPHVYRHFMSVQIN